MSKRDVSNAAHDPVWRSRIAAAVAPHGRLKAIATAAEMESPQLQKIANGTTRDPSVATLARIARAMYTSLEELIREPRPKETSDVAHAGQGNVVGIEDRLADLIAYIKTLEGHDRSRFIRAAIALLTALEHARPATGTGTTPDDVR